MKPYFAMGLFALYVVVVSLVRVMADQEFPRLTAMKRFWGRKRGIAMHFLACVALPMVLGIVFLTRGVAGFGSREVPLFAPVHHQAALARLQYIPETPVYITPEESIRTGEIPILLAGLPARPAEGPRHLKVDFYQGIP